MTRLKCRSWVGLLDVAWHILYTPTAGSVTVTLPASDTMPPWDESACIAPSHETLPAGRKTTVSPALTVTPLKESSVVVVAKKDEGWTPTLGGEGGGEGSGDGGGGDGDGGEGGGAMGGGVDGGGGGVDGGGGDGSGGIG